MATTTPQNAAAAAPAAPKYPNQVTGMYVLGRAIKMLGIDKMYGLVGIPITEAAYLIQGQGVKFVSFRFEQQAGMAAATHGYLTKTPGVFMTVSSLGFLNGLTATINATVNCYPVIQISGSSDRTLVDLNKGDYESFDQYAVAKPLVKAAFRVNRPEDIPSTLARAYRAAVSGRPGGVYVDLTVPSMGGILDRDVAEAALAAAIPAVDVYSPVAPNEASIDRAVELLQSAKKPAILLGKGAAYAQVDDKIKTLIEKAGIPYYPMSMAKGLMPDNGPLSAISCRSTIMEESDVVMIIGARLNWMLGFGKGKWNPNGKFIQLEVEPTEIDVNRRIDAPVVGDMGEALDAILAKLDTSKMQMDPTWVPGLQAESAAKNKKFAARLEANANILPMNQWTALSAIKPIIESNPDIVLINEGANTLDNTRDTIDMSLPRHRVDCATWAIMGMGIGSAVGAAVATGKQVVAIEGDSAFGFSGMEISTISRFNLPVTVVIFNNGGIYNGIGKPMDNTTDPAPTTLNINDRYDKMGEAFGLQSYYVENPADLSTALKEAIASKKPSLIEVRLASDAGKESGHIGYLNPQPLQQITV
ncbi:MAG: oxalyl-CoA decarboxylase [Muribaculaceae bacterium]|nr:oxalyl-CoA decarboxylase [Muribaculaceae bacterium]